MCATDNAYFIAEYSNRFQSNNLADMFGSVDETDFELASQQSAEATKNVRASNMEAQPDQNVNPA